ncbi:splicing factor 1-like [Bacillus rossius redtenbacheri]|uniref:splicing factor 1-like n=1 Tax=Bacillus rossius redtenbacheri TaxID=93214 RepID=UPI002FDCEFD0
MTSNGAGGTVLSSETTVNYVALLNVDYIETPNGIEARPVKRERDREKDRERSSEEKQLRRLKKRRSRWGGDDNEKTFIPGMPTVLPTNLSKEQEQAYLVQLQIEEISRKLRTGELGISPNPEERSPSPEPIYSSDGKRLNTREYRTRRKLEEERHHLIQEMTQLNPEFKPPADYKPPIVRVSDKVMIPQDDHPDINFVGLLIGPRGNTLKSMERETGAKIIIRGKGSVKEGKVGRKDGQPLPGEDEPLHAYVTANNPEAVKKAVDRIKEIIRQGVEVPEGQNDLRRMQLRELALLNGTLRENEGPRCTNCGASDHKSWMCPDKPNVTNNIICASCGGVGHIARDCRQKKLGASLGGAGAGEKTKIDEEYLSLMAELGEGTPPARDANKDKQRFMPRNRLTPMRHFDRPAPMRAIMPPARRPPAGAQHAAPHPPGPRPPPSPPGMDMPPPRPRCCRPSTSPLRPGSSRPPPPAMMQMPPPPPRMMSWIPAQPPPPGSQPLPPPVLPPPVSQPMGPPAAPAPSHAPALAAAAPRRCRPHPPPCSPGTRATPRPCSRRPARSCRGCPACWPPLPRPRPARRS